MPKGRPQDYFKKKSKKTPAKKKGKKSKGGKKQK